MGAHQGEVDFPYTSARHESRNCMGDTLPCPGRIWDEKARQGDVCQCRAIVAREHGVSKEPTGWHAIPKEIDDSTDAITRLAEEIAALEKPPHLRRRDRRRACHRPNVHDFCQASQLLRQKSWSFYQSFPASGDAASGL